MNEALVKDTKNDISREDRSQNQDALSPQGILEDLRRALETGRDARRQALLALQILDRGDRVAKRGPRRQVERDRHRGLLALVIDLQRAHSAHELGHGGERHDRARRGLQIDAVERLWTALEFRLGLQNDLVVVRGSVDRGDLARAEGVVELLPNL